MVYDSMQLYVISRTVRPDGSTDHQAHPFNNYEDLNKRKEMGFLTGSNTECLGVLEKVCLRTYEQVLKPAIKRANQGEQVNFRTLSKSS